MSDPLGHSDIEDVLSSIRRLVAGDQKSNRKDPLADADQSAANEDASDSGDALVLTPSLRVEDAETPDTDTALWEADGLAEHTGDDDLEDVAPVHSDYPDEVEQIEATEETFPGVEANPTDESEEALDAEGREEPEDDLPTFIRPILSDEIKVTSRKADPLDAVNEDSLSDDTKSASESGFGLNLRNAPRAGFHFGALEEEGPAEDSEAITGDTADTDERSDADTGSAAEEIDLETESSEAEGAGEPATVTEEPELKFVHHSEDHWLMEEAPRASRDTLAQGESENVLDDGNDDPEGGSQNLFANDDLSLDEEALRALVSEMVNRELQGALGERITRNVRKLVRREIHRALATRDFD